MLAVLQQAEALEGRFWSMNTMPTDARRLLLHRDLAELKRLPVWIEDWATRDLSPELSFAVQVGLEEAVANIIMYGAAPEVPLEIMVEVERTDQAVVVRIEDNGSAFDPTQAPPPPLPASLAQAQVGYLGIHLMRRFASGMRYERRDSRNRLTMQFAETDHAKRRSACPSLRPPCRKRGPTRSSGLPVLGKKRRGRAKRARC
jgi:serine/threonine-protein kinase RsbW